VHDFGTPKAAQCRLPIFTRVWPQDSSEFAGYTGEADLLLVVEKTGEKAGEKA